MPAAIAQKAARRSRRLITFPYIPVNERIMVNLRGMTAGATLVVGGAKSVALNNPFGIEGYVKMPHLLARIRPAKKK